MRQNKDSEGNLTDEAIEAVEQELKELAEKIGATEEELGERIAYNTFRWGFDFIEPELAVMKCSAVDILNERSKRLIAQTKTNRAMGDQFIPLACFCGFIGCALNVYGGWIAKSQMAFAFNSFVAALVYVSLFILLMVAVMNFHAVSKHLFDRARANLEIASEILT